MMRSRTGTGQDVVRAYRWLTDMIAAPVALVVGQEQPLTNGALERLLARETERGAAQLRDAILKHAEALAASRGAGEYAGHLLPNGPARIRTLTAHYVVEILPAPAGAGVQGLVRVLRTSDDFHDVQEGSRD